jgi:ATP-dependent DNA ligase
MRKHTNPQRDMLAHLIFALPEPSHHPYSAMPLPRWVEPQLSKLVQRAPTGPNWVHEIKFNGYRMAARIERGKVQLLTRSGLDWTAKYPATAAVFGR